MRFVSACVVVLALAVITSSAAYAQSAGIPVPNDKKAWEALAYYYADEEMKPELDAYLDATEQAYPNGQYAALVSLYRGISSAVRWRPQEAAPYLQQTIERFPGTREAQMSLYWQGYSLCYRMSPTSGGFAEAMPIFDQVIGTYPDSEAACWASLRLANIHGRTSGQAALDEYRELTERCPGSQPAARAQSYLAGALAKMGRNTDAAAEYQRLIDEWTGIARSVEIAKAHDAIAKIAEQGGDYAEAIRRRQKILNNFCETRTSYDAYYWLTQAYRRANNLPQAIADLEADIPQCCGVRCLAGLLVLQRLYLDVGNTAKAQEVRAAIQQYPSTSQAHTTQDLSYGVMMVAEQMRVTNPAEYARIMEDRSLLYTRPR